MCIAGTLGAEAPNYNRKRKKLIKLLGAETRARERIKPSERFTKVGRKEI